MPETLKDLMARHAQAGSLSWIGVRPEKHGELVSLPSVAVEAGGLAGDHRNKPGPRAVTLIQAEHLPVIAALAGLESVNPGVVRRNLLVSGINLLALRNRPFRIGQAVFKGTGLCAPCSRMEAALGPGGYNAMRGHGGITAEVMTPGVITLNDEVAALPAE